MNTKPKPIEGAFAIGLSVRYGCAHAGESLRGVSSKLAEFVERVSTHRERVVITRNGSPAAVLMSPDDLESIEETLAALDDSEAVAALAEAHRACLDGNAVRGVDAVRALRPS